MFVKALTSFTGHSINMAFGEVREITGKAILSDLLGAGYIEEVKPITTEKGGEVNEGKRSNSSKRG